MEKETRSTTVLIIDDESFIRDFITNVLEDRYHVVAAASGLEGVRLAKSAKPDVILLDILMPGNDGIACLEEIRAQPETAKLPVLMLTAMNESDVRIRAFNAGADDFIAKPFQPDELIARIDSKLDRIREFSKEASLILQMGNVVVDLESLRVTVDQNEVNLGPVEFKILSMLMRHKGRLTRRDELERFVWPNEAPAERGLDTHIFSLRKKLLNSHLQLQTVYGTGYTLSVKANVH